MQSQIVCSGCRTTLLYPSGASNISCPNCSMVISVPQIGMEMAQLICVGCRHLLMYIRGASGVRCPNCHTMNVISATPNNIAHINCANCQTMLMYHVGAPSIMCTSCQFVTNVIEMGHAHNETVVVHNPATVDENGRLVDNVVIGMTTSRC